MIYNDPNIRGGIALPNNNEMFFKTGELAGKCGVTIRTLRFYDRKSLLKPSGRTEAGHRLYSMKDMVKLQHILTLKFIGLSLNAIKDTMAKNSENLNLLLRSQRNSIEQKIEHMQLAVKAIKQAEDALVSSNNLSMENVIKVIKAVQAEKSHEYCTKFFSEEQLQKIQDYPDEQLDNYHKKWDELLLQAKKLLLKGENPESKASQMFAGQWIDMVRLLADGDEDVEASFHDMCKYTCEIDQEKQLISSEVFNYIEKACEILKKNRRRKT
jgi:DNA-binding transcriptional MerR regulator